MTERFEQKCPKGRISLISNPIEPHHMHHLSAYRKPPSQSLPSRGYQHKCQLLPVMVCIMYHTMCIHILIGQETQVSSL